MATERKIITSYGPGRKFKTAKEAMEHVVPFVGKEIDHTDIGGILHWYRLVSCKAHTRRDGSGDVWVNLREVQLEDG